MGKFSGLFSQKSGSTTTEVKTENKKTGGKFSGLFSDKKEAVKVEEQPIINEPIEKTVNFPEHLGGGQYKTSGPGSLIKTERDYGGIETEKGSERDHVFPVSLGGTSDKENIELKANTKEGRQEGKVEIERDAIKKFQSGEISLAEARAKILNKQQEIKGLIPEQGTKAYLAEGAKDAVVDTAKGLSGLFKKASPKVKDFSKNLLDFVFTKEGGKTTEERNVARTEMMSKDKEQTKENVDLAIKKTVEVAKPIIEKGLGVLRKVKLSHDQWILDDRNKRVEREIADVQKIRERAGKPLYSEEELAKKVKPGVGRLKKYSSKEEMDMDNPIIKALNTKTGKKMVNTIADKSSDLPLKSVAALQAVGDKTYEEAKTELLKRKDSPDISYLERLGWEASGAVIQTGIGVLLALGTSIATKNPGAGKILAGSYWSALSASEQIQDKDKVYSLSNIGIDVVGDSVLEGAIAKMGGNLLTNKAAKGFVTEGGTEVAQTFLKKINDYASEPDNEKADKTMDELKAYTVNGGLMTEFLIGGISGGGLSILAGGIFNESDINMVINDSDKIYKTIAKIKESKDEDENKEKVVELLEDKKDMIDKAVATAKLGGIKEIEEVTEIDQEKYDTLLDRAYNAIRESLPGRSEEEIMDIAREQLDISLESKKITVEKAERKKITDDIVESHRDAVVGLAREKVGDVHNMVNTGEATIDEWTEVQDFIDKAENGKETADDIRSTQELLKLKGFDVNKKTNEFEKLDDGDKKIVSEAIKSDNFLIGKTKDSDVRVALDYHKEDLEDVSVDNPFKSVEEAKEFLKSKIGEKMNSDVINQPFYITQITIDHLFGDSRHPKDSVRRARLLKPALEILSGKGMLISIDPITDSEKGLVYYEIIGKMDNRAVRVKLSEINKNGKVFFTVSDISGGTPFSATPSNGRSLGGLTTSKIDNSTIANKSENVNGEKLKISDSQDSFNMKVDDAKDWLNEKFGDGFIDFLTNLKGDNNTQGRYFDAMIQVVQQNGKVQDFTLYHEAFHSFLDKFIPKKISKEYLDIIKKEFPDKVKKVTDLYEKHGEYMNEDIAAEEVMADLFAYYSRDKQSVQNGKLKEFFDKLLEIIKKWLREINSSANPDVNELFDFILSGKVKKEVVKNAMGVRKKITEKAGNTLGEVLRGENKQPKTLRPEIQKKIEDLIKQDQDLTEREMEYFSVSEPFSENEFEDQYQSFKRILKTTSASVIGEFEDAQQFKNKMAGRKVTIVKSRTEKDGAGESVLIKSKKVINVTPEVIDNALYSQDVGQDDVFIIFKERILEERENRGLKMKFKQDRKELEQSLNRINRQIKLEEERGGKILDSELLGYEKGYLEAKRDYENKMNRRRYQLRIAKDYFKLSDAEARSISHKDIRYMTDEEFKDFLGNFSAKANDMSQTKQSRQAVLAHIQALELQKTENLQQAMKLPSVEKMNLNQLDQFFEALQPYEMGDEFLSVRKLETLVNTELSGMKTTREIRANLVSKIGPETYKINVGVFDKFKHDTALARTNPFYNLMVQETLSAELKAENYYLQFEKMIDRLARDSRKSEKTGIKKKLGDVLIAQDKKVFAWLESDNDGKNLLAAEMTEEQLKFAYFVYDAYRKMRDILVQKQALDKYKENYITHSQRSFWEAVKDNGFITAIKEAKDKDRNQEAYFNIISDTGEILPLEKFFQFSLKRWGKVPPTKNVARAFLTYSKAFFRKDFFDSIIPMLDSYVFVLQDRTKKTKRGIELDKSLKTFFNDWMNTQKGRTKKLFLVDQGDKIDTALRAANAMVTMIDLGLNIPVGIASNVGEIMMNFVNLGAKKMAIGVKRKYLNPKKSERIFKSYENFVGKGPWEEMTEVSKDIGDRLTEGMFFLFRNSTSQANRTFLLGSMTEEEYQNEEISSDRLAQLKLEMGKYRPTEGSESIVGATSVGKTLTKYKSWAVPALSTSWNNIQKITSIVKKHQNPLKSNEFWELFRATIPVLIAYSLFSAGVDADDDSQVAKLIAKIRREMLSSIGAMSPQLWLSVPRLAAFLNDLGAGTQQLILLETYKTKEGLKGVGTLQNTLEPKVIKQVLGQ